MRRSEYSYLISLALHVGILLLLLVFNINQEYETEEYVTIGFGTYGRVSSSGKVGNPKEQPAEKKEIKKKEEKKVEVPKVKNSDETNNVVAAKDEKEKKEEKKLKKKEEKKDEANDQGRDVAGAGTGMFGFDIDFGGKGKRNIYSYSLPPYPSGVSKEIDVKLKFTILPDGTVGRIIPLRKADAKLEEAAINSLKRWRFEPLPNSQKQSVQTAVIIFPFRLQ